MVKNKLSELSITLAIEVVRYCKWLMNEKREYIMSKQLLRSGTSVGANVHEANYASSRADFINKLQIALKEASETEYWLTVLQGTDNFSERFSELPILCSSMLRLLTASLNTAKEHQFQQRIDHREKKGEC